MQSDTLYSIKFKTHNYVNIPKFSCVSGQSWCRLFSKIMY